jgi:CRISPR-associated endonuclease/helicase Cas3
MEFYSHADRDKSGVITYRKKLKEHLGGVAEAMCDIIQCSPLQDKEEIYDIGHIVGLCHDFGKYTKYFQGYLLNNINYGGKKNHGFISALFSSYQSQRFSGSNEYIPLFVYLMVLHHHGDLKNMEADLPRAKGEGAAERMDILKIQLEDIKRNIGDIKHEYSEMDKTIDVDGFMENWEDFYKHLWRLKFEYSYNKNIDGKAKMKNSLYMLFIYSTLIDSDKRDAGRVKPPQRMPIPESIVDDYRCVRFSHNDDDPMTAVREGVYNSITNNIENMDLDNHILTITAPTGSGKTLAGVSAALKLRHRLSRGDYVPRIIYALPFTSIIDQNYDVIRDVLKTGIKDFDKNESNYLIKHHYLADIRYTGDDQERPVDEALALIEAWESEIVVTTFVQFFYTLIGYRNRMLKKYHNMAGSIVILDEVQNIPMEYWDDVGMIMRYASQYLGIYIILMTATKPLLFAEGEYHELVDDPDRYFKNDNLNRVCLYPHMEDESIDEFVDKFIESYDTDKSYLIVMNTVDSSLDVFDKLNNRLNFKKRLNGFKHRLMYLSANVVPFQRRNRIKEIKGRLKSGEKLIVVSTQVVEAGVDIDMDVVIRDLGPFDSIMQVAGRCNRENKGSKGEVHVFNMVRDSGSHYYERIYKKVHCATSSEVLKGHDVIEEKKFLDIINDYFAKAVDRTAQTNGALLKALEKMNFNDKKNRSSKNKEIEYVADFSLIDELPNYVDVFIDTKEKVKIFTDKGIKPVHPLDIWNKYMEDVVKMQDINVKRINYLKIKKYLREFTISINAKYLPQGLDECGLYMIPNDAISEYYDDATGYKKVRTEGIFS